MTLSELRDAVRIMVKDVIRKDGGGVVLAGPTIYTDTQVKDALNWAQQVYCQKTRVTVKEAAISTDGQGVGTLPAGSLGHPESVSYGGNVLDKSTVLLCDLLDPTWRSAGSPVRWHMHGDMAIRVSPVASGSATVRYLDGPVAMSADGDSPDSRIPTNHHRHLPFAASAYLLAIGGDNQDLEKSNAYMSHFDNLIKSLVSDDSMNIVLTPARP